MNRHVAENDDAEPKRKRQKHIMMKEQTPQIFSACDVASMDSAPQLWANVS